MEVREERLRSGRSKNSDIDMAEDSKQIRLLQEKLAAAIEEVRTCKEELKSANESAVSLEAQLRTTKLEAEVERLRAVKDVRSRANKERQCLREDEDKEIERLSMMSDQLKSENAALKEALKQDKERERSTPAECSEDPVACSEEPVEQEQKDSDTVPETPSSPHESDGEAQSSVLYQ